MKRRLRTLIALPIIAGMLLTSGCNAGRSTTRALIVNFQSPEGEYIEEIKEQETTAQGGSGANTPNSDSDENSGAGDNSGTGNNSASGDSSAAGDPASSNGGSGSSDTSSSGNGGSNGNNSGGSDNSSSTTKNTTAATASSKPSSSSNAAVTTSKPADSTEKPASSTTTKAAATTPIPASSFSADAKLSSTWNDGANYCGGYEVTITNKSGKDLSSWTATFTVPSGFKFTSSWNGEFSVSGTTATVKCVDYNAEVANGASFGFGFNYSSPKEFTLGKITVNGEGASSGGGGNSSGGGNTTPDTSLTTAGSTAKPAPADPAGSTPFSAHGKLRVKGTQIVDKNGNAYQLKGMSTHGLAWFPKFVNESCFKSLRDDWKINCIRIAMYTAENMGYCEGGNKAELKRLIDNAVTYADKLGLYIIIDWHVLHDETPQKYKAEAKLFFDEIASKYKNHDNILYEICNEPNGSANWSRDVKPYAEEIIPIIRKYDKDAIVIVGTPTWSQDIDQALSNPLKFDNVMYALHFYAATHTDWLRNRLKDCVNKGLPVFVTEFGCCDASGNGANDFNQTKAWLNLLDSYGISYMNWNLANKNESSSSFKESAGANGNWSASEYSESGAWIRKWFRGEISR